MLYRFSILAVATVCLSSSIRGVSPDKAELYKPDANGNWNCILDPNIVLRFDQVNDDFCDCPDGSDEPGTNACLSDPQKPLMFYCPNEGFFPGYIENFKLNDGVCDYESCCDGSDEYISGDCPNVCGKVKEQYDAFVVQKRKLNSDGLSAKFELESKALQIKDHNSQMFNHLSSEIARLEKSLEESIRSPSSKSQSRNIRPAQVRINEAKLKQLLEQHAQISETLETRIKLLESILFTMSENYNPNFNDAAVKTAIHSFQNYYSNKADTSEVAETYEQLSSKGFLKEAEQNEISHESDSPKNDYTVSNMLHYYFEKLVDSFPEHHMKQVKMKKETIEEHEKKDVNQDPTISNMLHYYYGKLVDSFQEKVKTKEETIEETIEETSKDVLQRPEFSKLKNELDSKKKELRNHEQMNNQNYGDNDILRALEGQWYEKIVGEYTYKIGFLDAIYQDNTLVGRFSGISGDNMEFVGGSRCWNGPQRSATVEMFCSPEFDLISVFEPQKCHYKFLLASPLVCKEMSDEELAKDFTVNKAELA